VNIIYNYIVSNAEKKDALDLAVVIEAQLLEDYGYKKCGDTANKFSRTLYNYS
jgi:hypothetical protein